MRLLNRMVPSLVSSAKQEMLSDSSEDMEQEHQGKNADDHGKRREEEKRLPIASVFNMDISRMEIGPGGDIWVQAAGLPRDGNCVQIEDEWVARVGAMSDVVVFLSKKSDTLIRMSIATREAATSMGIPRPVVLVGPFMDNDDEAFDALSQKVEGVVIQHRDLDDPHIEAEMLRRACSSLAERLMFDRASWSFAPAICVTGRLEVLELLPKNLAEFSLLDSPPRERYVPGGKLIVTEFTERRTWWTKDFATSGPKRLWCAAWGRDPRTPRMT